MLNAREAQALRDLLADYPAALYIPRTGTIQTCPSTAAQPHHCERGFDIPAAEAYARELRGHLIPCIVLAYGIPWSGT